jgi:hypothetical protein
MKSAFLPVPTTVVHPPTEHTITYTPESCLPHARAFIICFFGLNCRNFTISPVNHSWSFLRHCSSFSSLCATEPSPTIISRDAFRLYLIAGMAPRIRKRKDGMLYSDTYIARVHENTLVMGFVGFMVENRTKCRLNGRIGKCD